MDGLETEMEIKMLQQNVYELQKQLTAANKRIADLIEQITELKVKD